MDLTPSEDQLMILEAVRGVARRLAPRAAAWDLADRIDPEAFALVTELGLAGLFVDEAQGGAGVGRATAALVLEALAEGSGALALRLAEHALAVATLAAAGGTEALERISASARWAARIEGARVRGVDAGRTLHAYARWVIGGAEADAWVVTSSDGEVFLLEGGREGLQREPAQALGMRGAGLAHLRLEGAAAESVGNSSASAADRLSAMARLAVAAVGVGIGRAALAEARAYALERQQFGRPIADFQAIQWMIADAATELDAAALLGLRAGLALDAGESGAAEARTALILTSEAALSAAQKAIQIHGGYGFVRDFPVERLARDARYFGTALGGRDGNREALGRVLLDQRG